jgi:hypothetical protein
VWSSLGSETSFLKGDSAEISIEYYWDQNWLKVFFFTQLPYILQAIVYINMSFNLPPPDKNDGHVRLDWGWVAATIFLIVWILVIEVTQIKADGPVKYFKGFYNIIDFLVLVGLGVLLGFYFV